MYQNHVFIYIYSFQLFFYFFSIIFIIIFVVVSYYINTAHLRNDLGENLINEIVSINNKVKKIDGFASREETQYICI